MTLATMADDETVYSPATSHFSLPSETDLLSPTDMVVASQIITRSAVLEPGIYKMVNLGSGTAADLHGGDNESIIGFDAHGGENQQWEFIPSGAGYLIRCLRRGLYLAPTGIHNEALVIASEYPVSWRIEPEENRGVFKICWLNTDFQLDLRAGLKAPGTPVQLYALPNDYDKFVPSMWWRLIKLGPPAQRNELVDANGNITTTTTTVTTVTTTVVTKSK